MQQRFDVPPAFGSQMLYFCCIMKRFETISRAILPESRQSRLQKWNSCCCELRSSDAAHWGSRWSCLLAGPLQSPCSREITYLPIFRQPRRAHSSARNPLWDPCLSLSGTERGSHSADLALGRPPPSDTTGPTNKTTIEIPMGCAAAASDRRWLSGTQRQYLLHRRSLRGIQRQGLFFPAVA